MCGRVRNPSDGLGQGERNVDEGIPMTMRGAALVDTVIDRVRGGEADFDIAWPDPLPMDLLHGLTLPGGLPLPPSLRQWLAFDGTWLERVSACWGGPSYPAFRAVTVAQAVRE